MVKNIEATIFKRLRKIGKSHYITIDPVTTDALGLSIGDLVCVKISKIETATVED